MNQSRASAAARSRAPGSSNRWVAPGIYDSALTAQEVRCPSIELEHDRVRPTISSVGATTSASRGPARSGRPPRETTAETSEPGAAAAHNAAAAPVLAPK